MSVSLKTRKLLGSDIGPEGIVGSIRDAVYRMDTDAREMGVAVNWSTIHMVLGEEHDEYRTNGEVWGNVFRPYLEIEVTGEKE